MKRYLTRKNGVIVFLIILFSLIAIVWINRTPAIEPIPMGFTLLGIPTNDGELKVSTVDDPQMDLRLTYTTGLLVVENKTDVGSDPIMIGGGVWYYRQPAGNTFKVVVISGKTKVIEFDDIMIATNNCPQEEGETCTPGTVRLLNLQLETILAETSARQYVVINP